MSKTSERTAKVPSYRRHKKAVVSPMDSSGDVERRHKPPSEQVL